MTPEDSNPTSEEKQDFKLGLTQEQLLEYVITKASQSVDQRIRSREERRLRTLTISLSVFTFLGIGGLITYFTTTLQGQVNGLKSEITQEVEEKLEYNLKKGLEENQRALTKELASTIPDKFEIAQLESQIFVDETIEEELDDAEARSMSNLSALEQKLEYQTLLQSFGSLALGLDLSDDFTREERDRSYAMLNQLLSYEKVNFEPAFYQSVEKVLEAFYEADLLSQLCELGYKLRAREIYSNRIVNTMVLSYGETIGGSLHSKDDLEDELEGFRYYSSKIDASEDHIILISELFVACRMFDGNTDRFQRLLEEIDSPGSSEKDVVNSNILKFAMLSSPGEIELAEDMGVTPSMLRLSRRLYNGIKECSYKGSTHEYLVALESEGI